MTRSALKRLVALERHSAPSEWRPQPCILVAEGEDIEARKAEMVVAGQAAADDEFFVITMVAAKMGGAR